MDDPSIDSPPSAAPGDAGMVMLDRERRVVLTSGVAVGAVLDQRGGTLESVVGERAAAALDPLVDEALAGRSRIGEVTLDDGRVLSVCGAPCHVAGAACVLSARDVTRERQLETRLRDAHRLETVGTLARRMAHDFNNILMGILGCADLAQRMIDDESRAHPFLEELKQAALRGSTLTRQLLVVARRSEARPALMRLEQAVGECERLLRAIVTDTIRLERVASGEGWAVRADHVELQQSLVHLLLNARDAMPSGGTVTVSTDEVTVSDTTVAPEGLAPGDYCVLSVEDDGPGMAPEVRDRALEPFFTTSAATRSGLGLTTVAEFARRAGGAALVTSAEGRGTRVSIFIPRAVPLAPPG
ncbi:MAG: hypothetical protein EP329_04000 [Deltaproteobacteria bacterium]|nr:MAG: hypothetical protein EP329_04000 [Deltaproteobacteria bacterium]